MECVRSSGMAMPALHCIVLSDETKRVFSCFHSCSNDDDELLVYSWIAK